MYSVMRVAMYAVNMCKSLKIIVTKSVVFIKILALYYL